MAMEVTCSRCRKVKALCACPAAPIVHDFHLDDGERFLFDLWANEHTGIAGTEIDYWALDFQTSRVDPLYGEAVDRRWKGPARLKGWASYADHTPEVNEQGLRTVFSGSVWIPRRQFEDANIDTPSPGDIIRFWKNPFFDKQSVDEVEGIPLTGYFFDVTNVDEDGHLFDAATFVGFRIDYQRRTEFTPERRLTNE